MLLERLGIPFDIEPPDVDESPLGDETPAQMVERVARLKAEAVVVDLPVVAADTTVVLDGGVLGKPSDPAHAADMLGRLAGRRHTVATGVAVRGDRLRSLVVTAEVEFVPMSNDDISWYVATGEPLDKAGAYGLSGIGSVFVRRISGSHSTVIGLPLAETAAMLRAAGVGLTPP